MPVFESPQRGPLGGTQADNTKFIFAKKGGAQTAVALPATERFYNDSDVPLNVVAVRATLGTAPTGLAFIADVQKNGTSIYTGVTANRPTIAISGTTALGGTPAVTTVAPGEFLDFSVLQVGSTVAGSDLVIEVLLAS